MTIRSSKWSNRYVISASDPSANASFYEGNDIGHVRDKFSKAPKYLAERLGKANSRRRQYFKYQERHSAKLTQAINEDEDDIDVARSETIATAFHEEEITSNAKYREIDDIQSETSYASSVDPSNSSRMPAMPKQAENEKHFECPYCHKIEIVKNTHEWRKHIFSDLQPFMCTFEDCATADETYGSRREWFMHEFSCHRRVWTCGGHCNRIFQSSEELIEHVKAVSSLDITDQQIPAFLEMRSSPIARTATSYCPLCCAEIVGTKSLRRHLGKHLQEISLFVIPIADEEDRLNSGDSDSNRQNSLSGSNDLLDENRSSRSIIDSEVQNQAPTLNETQLGQIDTHPFPPSLVDSLIVGSRLPPEIKNWSQLRTWAAQNIASSEVLQKLIDLQILHHDNIMQSKARDFNVEPGKVDEKEPSSNYSDMGHEGPGEEKDRDLGKWLNQSYL